MTTLSECSEGYSLLTAYFKGVSTSVTSGVPPDVNTLSGALTYADLWTLVYKGSTGPADVSLGLAADTVSEFSSIQRELGILSLGKVSLYSSAASEAQDEADRLSQTSSFVAGSLKGSETTGTQS